MAIAKKTSETKPNAAELKEAEAKLKLEAKAKAKEDAKPKYLAKIARMWHPDQAIYITTSTPVALKMDSWLECQIEAKLIYQT